VPGPTSRRSSSSTLPGGNALTAAAASSFRKCSKRAAPRSARAAWAGVRAPVAEGLLAMGGAILGKDLMRGERTLEALGLAKYSRDQLFRLLDG